MRNNPKEDTNMQENETSQAGADITNADSAGTEQNTGNTTTQEAVRTVDPVQLEQSYKHLQEAYRQSREEIKGFKGQFEALNPQLEAVRKIQAAFQDKAEEKNFWQALPENYQSQEQKLQELTNKLNQYESRISQTDQYLASQAEAQEFKKFDEEVGGIYNSQQDLELAKQKIVEYIPNALEQWQNGRSLKSLHDEMIGKEYSNPSSPLVRSIQSRMQRQATMKSANYIDGSRGFNPSSGGSDDMISISPSQF